MKKTFTKFVLASILTIVVIASPVSAGTVSPDACMMHPQFCAMLR